MTTLITSPTASTAQDSEAEVGADGTDSTASGGRAPATSRRSVGTGVRNGLVRTRTVRSNTVRALLRMKDDRGAATAEYIVATMAAVGFAGLLIVILRGDEVRGILTELVRSALTVG